MNEKTEIRLSVRALVEFLLRSGDIDGRSGGRIEREAMQAGARIHRKIQKSRGSAYIAEKALSFQKDYGTWTLIVEGRADGIYEENGLTIVEEIKGMYADPERLEEPVPVHLAQARCYAYMIAREKRLKEVGLCMTYVNMETELSRRFLSAESFAQLETWFSDLIARYEPWALFRIEWEQIRDNAIRGLPFPFAYRPGQQQLVADIYRSILRKKQLFVYAPTGVGKTISAVFPAVHAIGEGLCRRLFYLTAKTVTGAVAQEAFRVLRESALSLKVLSLTAKEKICPLRDAHEALTEAGAPTPCSPDACPFAKGHFDRINDVLYAFLTRGDVWDRAAILDAAEEGQVCPYEMQTDLALFADAVIGDYNYVFDPDARLKAFFGENSRKDEAVLLIDEAHNLVDRGREMFSADLCREEFLAVRRLLKGREGEATRRVARAVSVCATVLLSWRKAAEQQEQKESTLPVIHSALPALAKHASVGFHMDELLFPLMTLCGRLEDALGEPETETIREELLSFYFRLRAFLNIGDLLDDHYVVYGYPLGKNDYYIKLFCVDPSANLQSVLDKARAAVLYSATLVPVRYYKSLLSGREDDYAVAVPSPFSEKNRLLLIGTDVSTLYARRTPEEFARIARYIDSAVAEKTGNYMVFLPSYRMLEDVYAVYEAIRAGQESSGVPEGAAREHLLQTRDMDERARRRFLESFAQSGDLTRVGFCVMGGIFAEGIDLAGDRLIGAIVVGTGIPQVGRERELLRAHYSEARGAAESRGDAGFDYAYRIPGMNKVLQAAGRVIRTESDRGWILLLDGRFAKSDYAACFPPAWHDRAYCTVGTVGDRIRAFWSSFRNEETR